MHRFRLAKSWTRLAMLSDVGKFNLDFARLLFIFCDRAKMRDALDPCKSLDITAVSKPWLLLVVGARS